MKRKFIIALLLSSLAVFSFGCSKNKTSNVESNINLLENTPWVIIIGVYQR